MRVSQNPCPSPKPTRSKANLNFTFGHNGVCGLGFSLTQVGTLFAALFWPVFTSDLGRHQAYMCKEAHECIQTYPGYDLISYPLYWTQCIKVREERDSKNKKNKRKYSCGFHVRSNKVHNLSWPQLCSL